jgi:hypothetical protein
MGELLTTLFSFPTVALTVPLGAALLYWLLVVAGAFELPTHGADGHGEGLLEGAEGAATVLSALRLRSAPLTVVLSVVTLMAWLLCAAGAPLLGRALGAPLGWLSGSALLVGSLLAAVPLTSLLVRPLSPLFEVHHARRREDLLGRECVIETGRVDSSFGQARMEDGGAGLLLQVRIDGGRPLERGDRVVLVQWDEPREAFLVERPEQLLRSHAMRVGEVTEPSGEPGGEGMEGAPRARKENG